MQLSNLSLPKSKALWALPVVGIIGMASLVASFNLSGGSENKWSKAATTIEPAVLNSLIDKNINISDKLTRQFVMDNTFVTKVNGLNIFHFNFQEACGYGGCLYVVQDGYAASKAFQLWDKPVFAPSNTPGHLIVEQKDKTYGISL
jgi:hypothetical protein